MSSRRSIAYATLERMLPLISVLLSIAVPPAPAELMVSEARRLLGVPYQFGGRMRKAGEGIDCQGVLFFAAERARACSWKSYSVFPTESVRDRELGAAVPGLSPVATASLDVSKLLPGDIMLLVGFDKNPAEGPIGELDGKPVWVWHTGMYSGTGQWIVGDHYAGKVVETPLLEYLREHADAYAGVFVTRMSEGPAPKRCRKIK